MKRLIVILLLIYSSLLYGQKNTMYVSFQPADLGLGIRYDHIFDDLGIYESISYGNWGIYDKFGLNHHVKISSGIMLEILKTDYNYKLKGNTLFFTTAINYHYLGKVRYNNEFVNPKIFNPFSFEFGVTTYTKNTRIGLRTDILRWEPCVDVKLYFN